ncbi:MAG: hypothetical protein MJ252_25075 [archaeon]|nr:hypothetical protein [archaeon]
MSLPNPNTPGESLKLPQEAALFPEKEIPQIGDKTEEIKKENFNINEAVKINPENNLSEDKRPENPKENITDIHTALPEIKENAEKDILLKPKRDFIPNENLQKNTDNAPLSQMAPSNQCLREDKNKPELIESEGGSVKEKEPLETFPQTEKNPKTKRSNSVPKKPQRVSQIKKEKQKEENEIIDVDAWSEFSSEKKEPKKEPKKTTQLLKKKRKYSKRNTSTPNGKSSDPSSKPRKKQIRPYVSGKTVRETYFYGKHSGPIKNSEGGAMRSQTIENMDERKFPKLSKNYKMRFTDPNMGYQYQFVVKNVVVIFEITYLEFKTSELLEFFHKKFPIAYIGINLEHYNHKCYMKIFMKFSETRTFGGRIHFILPIASEKKEPIKIITTSAEGYNFYSFMYNTNEKNLRTYKYDSLSKTFQKCTKEEFLTGINSTMKRTFFTDNTLHPISELLKDEIIVMKGKIKGQDEVSKAKAEKKKKILKKIPKAQEPKRSLPQRRSTTVKKESA